MDRAKTSIQIHINDAMLLLLSFIFVLFILTELAKTLLITITFILLFCLMFLNLRSIRNEYVILIFFNILSVICTLVMYKGIGVALIFLTLLLSCVCFNSISFSKEARRWAYLICCLGLLVMLASASDIYRPYGWLVFIDKYGNVVNNNTLGIFSVGFCFCLVTWNDIRKGKKWKKIISFVTFAVTFYFVFLTECRSAMLVLLLYFVLQLVIKKKLSDIVFRRSVMFVLLLSLLFTFFYAVLYSVWPNARRWGKELFSGREGIWIVSCEQIKTNLIFGSGTEFTVSGFESVHNMLLGVWKNMGVIPMISIIAVFVIRGRVPISRKQQIMLLSILIFSFFESFMMDFKFLLLFVFLLTGTNESSTFEKMEW